MNFEKLWQFGLSNAGKFKVLSDQFVDEKVEVDSEEARLATSLLTATHMAMGARANRNTSILVGTTIGVLGTVATLKVSDFIKKKKDEFKVTFTNDEGELRLQIEPKVIKKLEENRKLNETKSEGEA